MVNRVQSVRAFAVALFVAIVTLWIGAWSPVARASTLPTLEFASTPAASTVSDTVLIAGAAHGHGAGISDVSITSDLLGLTFSADIDAGGNFSLSLPLELGDNHIEVVPIDGTGASGLPTAFDIERTLPATPLLTIDEPNVNYQQTLESSIDIRGRVFTTLPIEDIAVRLGEHLAVPTQGDDAYEYAFYDVALGDGLNQIEVVVYSQYGSVNEAVSVDAVSSLNPDDVGPPPTIELAIVDDHIVVHGATYVLSGTVNTDCLSQLSVDGLSPDLVLDNGEGEYSFQTELSLTANESYEVLVSAVACDGAESGVTVLFERDDTPPIVVFTTPAPQEGFQTISTNPLRVTGYVDEPNLVGAMFSGLPLELEPAMEDGRWTFDVTVKLDRGRDTALTVTAWNSAGQSGSAGVGVHLDHAVELELLSPKAGDQFTLADGETEVAVEARLRDAGSNDAVWFQLDDEPAVPGGNGEGDHGTLLGPVAAGEQHTVTVWAESLDGTVLAEVQESFEAVDLDSIPLTIREQSPAQGAPNVETNQALTLHFNRRIEPSRIEVEVRETVHGLVYQAPSADTDLSNMSKVERVQVDREQDPVGGKTQNLPGNRIYSFSPTNPWTYGAEVDVSILVDEVQVLATSFQVREFPTLVHAFVLDRGFQPLTSVEVSLPELEPASRFTTTTDANGAFAFGWGWPSEVALPAGRHRVVLNPAGANPRFATVEGWLDVVDGENNGGQSFVLPEIPMDARFTSITGGEEHVLENGRLVLDLEDAVLQFADASGTGLVAPHLTDAAEAGYPVADGNVLMFAVRLDPGQVAVDGELAISVALPRRGAGFEYLTGLPHAEERDPLGLLFSIDPESLELVPSGVVEFDSVAVRAVMPRPTDRVHRLDVLAIGLVPMFAVPAALQYLDGEVDFDAVLAALTPPQ